MRSVGTLKFFEIAEAFDSVKVNGDYDVVLNNRGDFIKDYLLVNLALSLPLKMLFGFPNISCIIPVTKL